LKEGKTTNCGIVQRKRGKAEDTMGGRYIFLFQNQGRTETQEKEVRREENTKEK